MEHSAYLDMAAVEERHWWFAGRRRVLKAIIGRLGLKQNAAILELGSGTGGNFMFLSDFGQVTAVEMNETARGISRSRPGAADVHAGMLPDDLPLGDRKFDLVCMFDVLEHVEDDAGALRAARAHLAPKGVLLLTVPAYQALFGPHDEALHHKRRYEAAGLRARLQEAGLRVERLSFANAALLPVAWVLRWLDKLLQRQQATGSAVPAAPVNALLAAVFGAEAWILPHVSLPFGLSLIAVARADDCE